MENYWNKLRLEQDHKCDRCGRPRFIHELRDLKKSYQTETVKSLCEDCGKTADGFIDYYGEKSEKDKEKLFKFLSSES